MTLDIGRLQLRSSGSQELDVCADLRLVSVGQGISPVGQDVARLFEQLRDSIYRYVMLVIGNASDAEEITQEVFLHLYRCLQKGQTIKNVRAWTFRVAHNSALNRKNGAKHLVSMDWPAENTGCRHPCDTAPNPEESVLQQEENRRLQAAFSQLSVQQRQCLILRAEGLRYRQIAEVVGISVANVAQSLHRSIKKLTREAHG